MEPNLYDSHNPTSNQTVNKCLQNLRSTVKSLRNIPPGTEVYFRGHKFTQYLGTAIGSERIIKYLSGDSVAYHIADFQQAKQEIAEEAKTLHKFIEQHKNIPEDGDVAKSQYYIEVIDLKTELRRLLDEYHELKKEDFGLENFRKLLESEITEQWNGVTYFASKVVTQEDIDQWIQAYEKGKLTEDSIQHESNLERKRIMAKILMVGTARKAGLLSEIIGEIDKLFQIAYG